MRFDENVLNEKVRNLDLVLRQPGLIDRALDAMLGSRSPVSWEIVPRPWSPGGGATLVRVHAGADRLFLKIKSLRVGVESLLECENTAPQVPSLLNEQNYLERLAGDPRVPRVEGSVQLDGFAFLLLEELTSSATWLEVASAEAILKAWEDLAGLARKLHSMGLVHTDIHEGNVLFRGDQAVLCDFEECRSLEQNLPFEESLDAVGENRFGDVGDMPTVAGALPGKTCLSRLRKVWRAAMIRNLPDLLKQCNFDSSCPFLNALDHGKDDRIYQSIAVDGLVVSGQRPVEDRRIPFLLKCFSELMGGPFTHLDVGANLGRFNIELARSGKVRRSVGVEAFERYVALGRCLAFLDEVEDKVELYAAECGNDLISSLVEPGSIDCVTIYSVYHHIHDKQTFLSDLRRLAPRHILFEMPVQPECYEGRSWQEELDRIREALGYGPWTQVAVSEDYQRPVVLMSQVVPSTPRCEPVLSSASALVVGNGRRPKVSIVLPTYNHLSFLPRAIESVLAQTMDDYELIVVDDGSTDGTGAWLDSLSHPRLQVIHQENARLPSALNRGFAQARGEFLTWTSADNLLAPAFLATLVAALESRPDAVMAVAGHSWIGPDDTIEGVHRRQDLSPVAFLTANPGIAAFLYRRTARAVRDGYDPSLEGAEDWDMWLRLSQEGAVLRVPDVLYHYRRHGDSMTVRKQEQVARASREVFARAFARSQGLSDPCWFPALESCRDREKAVADAFWDFGVRLALSPSASDALSLEALDRALAISEHPQLLVARILAGIRRGDTAPTIQRLLERLSQMGEQPRSAASQIAEILAGGDASPLLRFVLPRPGRASEYIRRTEEWAEARTWKPREFFFSAPAKGRCDDDAIALLEAVQKDLEAGRFEAALAGIERVRGARGVDAEALLEKVRTLQNCRRRAEAPAALAPLLDRAERELSEGKNDAALETLRQAEAEAPHSLVVVNAIAWQFASQNRLSEAHAEYIKAAQIAPKDPSVHINLAGIRLRLGLPERAEASLVTALHLNPEDPEVLLALARIRHEAGDLPAAAGLWRRFLASAPEGHHARNEAAKALELIGTDSDATAKKAPLVSVIVPTHNRPELLPRALESLAHQRLQDFEVVVVNDAGQDVSKIVEAFDRPEGPRFRYLTNPKNLGLAGTRNAGLRAARGTLVAFLDDDDLVSPEHLELLVTARRESGARVVYGNAWQVYEKKCDGVWTETGRNPFPSLPFSRERLLVRNLAPVHTMLCEHSLLDELGGFDESLELMEDWDLWLRASRLADFHRIEDYTCEYRWRGDNSVQLRRPEFPVCRRRITAKVDGYLGKVLRVLRQDLENDPELAGRTLVDLVDGQEPGTPSRSALEAAQSALANGSLGRARELVDVMISTMSSVLSVLVCSYDHPASNCAHLRVVQHFEADPSLRLRWFDGVHGNLLQELAEADVVLVQRGFPQDQHAMAAIRESGKPWAFEMDDLLWLDLPENNPHREYFRQLSPLLAQALRDCDAAITSSTALGIEMERLAADVHVVPNLLDPRLWADAPEPSENGPVVIAYAGTATHATDLVLVEDVLERIARVHGDKVAFHFLGCATPRLAALPNVRISEFAHDYAAYARTLASAGIHVALAPLEDNSFNRAKSAIKWLEYSACHCAGVYADLPPYQQDVRDGENGFLAGSDPEIWFDRIDRLVRDPELRRRLAEAAHADVLARHMLVPGNSPLARALHAVWSERKERAEIGRVSEGLAPEISIVIPVHGKLELTQQCLDSLERTAADVSTEIVVVDDASPDGTAAWLSEQQACGRLRAVRLSENRGFAKACNAGAKAARGKLLVFLNNDTVAHQGWLVALTQTLCEHPECGLAGSRLLYPDGRIQHAGIAFGDNGVPDHPYRFAEAQAPEVTQALEVPAVTGACVLIPAELFQKLGGFDESYPMYVEDVDLCLKVWQSGRSVRYVPESTLTHLEGCSSTDLVKRARSSEAGLQRMWDKWRGNWPEAVRRHPWAPAWQRRDLSIRWSGRQLAEGVAHDVAELVASRLNNIAFAFSTDAQRSCDACVSVDDPREALTAADGCKTFTALLLQPPSDPTPEWLAALQRMDGLWCIDAAWISLLESAGVPAEKLHLLPLDKNFNAAMGELIRFLATAAEAPAPALRWCGPLFNYSGYARQNREAVAALTEAGVQVSLDPLQNDPAFFDNLARDPVALQIWKPLLAAPSRDGLFVCSDVPCNAKGTSWLWREMREVNATAHAFAGWTMFETEGLPDGWATACNEMDDVWVPSTFNLRTFAAAGVDSTKLHVVPDCIDAAPYLSATPYALLQGPGSGYTFLSVFQWIRRKGWDVLLSAWAKAFRPDDDVRLVLRSYPFGAGEPVSIQMQRWLSGQGLSLQDMAPVHLLEDFLPDAAMPSLYAACDSFVLPTRGEGWGLPYMEAMAAGKPCIATAWSGQMDFLHEGNAWLLGAGKFVRVDAASIAENPYFSSEHLWADPSSDELALLLRRAFEDRDEGRKKGICGRSDVVERWNPRRTATAIRERLDALSDLHHPRSAAFQEPPVNHAKICRESAEPLHLRWEGSVFVNHSLAQVNRELCLSLALRGHDLSLVPYEPDEFRPEPGDRLEPLAQLVNAPLEAPAEVHVRHQWPPMLVPPSEGRWVAIQPWEFGPVPKTWVEAWKCDLDELWVPSQFVKDGYVASGLPEERVAVIPNGVDAERFRPGAAPFEIPVSRKFRFLFVGGTIYRKGIDILLTAYARAFRAGDEVTLIVKDMGGKSFYKGQTAGDLFERFGRDAGNPELVVIDESLSDAQMPGLYAACDCLVHPYRGEGFGMPIAEAMACGLPVIVTDGGPAKEFCGPDNAWFVPASRKDLPGTKVGEMECAGQPWLLEPDPDALAKLLRKAWEDREEGRTKGRCGRERILAGYTWDHMADRVEAHLRALSQAPRRAGVPLAPRHNLLDPSQRDTHAEGQDEKLNLLLLQIEPALARGDVAETRAIANEAVERFPNHPLAWLSRAMLQRGASQYAKALADIEHSITCKETPEALQEAIRCYLALGKKGDATRLFARLEREHGPWCAVARKSGHWIGDDLKRGSGAVGKKHKKAKR